MIPENNKPLDVLPVKDGVIPVDEWKPNEEDVIVTYSGKSIIIPFGKLIYGVENEDRDMFFVSYKDSYVKKFEQITHYINYFIKFYDDGELILNYLYCKYFIDSKKNNPNRKSMIRYLYETFVTPSMYDKIMRFVEDNYRIDLAQNKDANKVYSESLEFTNRHAKLLILISTFIKMMIPIVMHYISVIKGKTESKNLIMYFKPLFEVVERKEHVDLYAKMFNSINVKVNFNESKNRIIWAKYAANGIDPISYTEELLDKNLIVDNIFKYNFYESIIAFNSVILKTQLQYRCIKNFGITMREISDEKDSEGLSYLDKLEMNTIKIDESLVLLSAINIKATIKSLKRKFHIRVPKEEIDFYLKNHSVNKLGKTLVFYYYAKYFGGFNDLKHITLPQYIKLMVMMKRKLQMLGYECLPMVISASLAGRLNSKAIQNAKFLEEVEDSPVYKNLTGDKYKPLVEMGRSDLIVDLLGAILSIQLECVEYDFPEDLGKPIEFDPQQIAQEVLDFIDQI